MPLQHSTVTAMPLLRTRTFQNGAMDAFVFDPTHMQTLIDLADGLQNQSLKPTKGAPAGANDTMGPVHALKWLLEQVEAGRA